MKKKLTIVLADPPMVDLSIGYYQPTLGILYLIGALRKHLPEDMYEVHYLEGGKDRRSQKEVLARLKPDIFGMSFKTPLAPLAYKVLNEYKKILPGATFITGGAHSSIVPGEVLERAPVDFVFKGECEESFPFFIRHFINGNEEMYNTPGLVFRRDGQIISNPLMPFEKEIDKYAWPAWDMIDVYSYPGMPYRKAYPYMGVVISRGCPFACTFCSEPIWKIFGKPSYRARDIDEILKEITYLYGRGVREIRLWCEELNTKSSWAKDLMRGIRDLGYRDMAINFNIRGDNIDEELALLMKEAGTWMVSMGIESSSDRVLKGVRKKVTIAQIERSCHLLSDLGIKIQGYFQFFNVWEEDGKLQKENFADTLATLRWAFKQFNSQKLHYMFTSFSTPRPDTPLWQIANKYKLFKGKRFVKEVNYMAEGMSIPGITVLHYFTIYILSTLLKAYVAVMSKNLNTRVIFRSLNRHLLKKFRVQYSEGY